MRIVNYSESQGFEDIETLEIRIKAIPFEGGYVPAFILTSPDDDYSITMDELHCLMDGVEIAEKKIDDIIDFILRSKVFNDEETDERPDFGESD